MPVDAVLGCRGLQLGRNALEAPRNGLEVATNCVVPLPGVLEPRRGQYDARGYSFSGRGDAATFFQDTLLVHTAAGSLLRDTGSAFAAYSGTYATPEGATRVRFAQAARALFLAAAQGVQVLSAVAGAWRAAGVPQALTPRVGGTGSSGFLPTGGSVNYRVVFGRMDANGRLLLGAPSGLRSASGPVSGSHNIDVIIRAVDGITTSDFVRVYRSETVTTGVPSDELYLAYEGPVPVASGEFTVTDMAPDDFLGVPLYTNADTGDGGGLAQANMPPPIARDVCEWQGRLWYADVTGLQRFELQLVGTGSPDGLQLGDSITIAGQTYTATTGGSSGLNFHYYDGGTPASNVLATAMELVHAVNSNASSAVWARYVSGENDAPGLIRLEAKALSTAAFVVFVNRRATAWAPVLTTSATGARTSTAFRLGGGLMYSKPGQPEAVPEENYLEVGDPGRRVLRIVAARERLWVWKEEGIYTVSGEAAPFRVQLADASVRCVAPDTVQVHAGQVYGLTTQGVVAVSDAGVRLVSTAIEAPLLQVLAEAATAVRALAFAASYESDRQYLLWLPTANSATAPSVAYVYNSLSDAWTLWEVTRDWAGVHPTTDVLHIGTSNGTTGQALQERKARTRTDYADTQEAVTISSGGTPANGRQTVVLSVGTVVGDVLVQGAREAVVETQGIAGGASTLRLVSGGLFGAGAATLYRSYSCTLRSMPHHGGAPALEKEYEACTLHFRRYGLTLAPRVTFVAEGDGAGPGQQAPRAPTLTSEEWSADWGDAVRPRNRKVGVPRQQSRATQLAVGLTVREARAAWALHGYSLHYEGGSGRNSR